MRSTDKQTLGIISRGIMGQFELCQIHVEHFTFLQGA